MDNDDFLNAFMGVDILKVEGVSEIIGKVIAKLRGGMIAGGMQPYEADALIDLAFNTLLSNMKKWAVNGG